MISNGAVVTTNDSLMHYAEAISAGGKFFFRRGVAYALTAGAFARAEVILYTSFRSCGRVFAPREIVYQPTNEDTEVSMFPLTAPFPAVGVSKAKAALIAMDNDNAYLEYQLFARAFNDAKAPGAWQAMQGGFQSTSAGDWIANTTELSFAGVITLANYQWVQLGLGLRKSSAGNPNSRVILEVTPAITY